MVFISKGRIDVKDGAFVVIDEVRGERMHIPIGATTCLMLEPGTRISHAAVKLAATVGTLLIWIGDANVRMYAAGQPGGARSDRLLYQARLALDESLRIKVIRKMFALRFGEEAPIGKSVEQLRGIEGARVRKAYASLAEKYKVEWNGRLYDPKSWSFGDKANQCISSATACLYGITEAAILAAGYAPAIGFLHTGKPLSFVYDIADIVKFETVVPIAFETAASNPVNPSREVRIACRESFRTRKILKRLIPLIEEVLSAGEIEVPLAPRDIPPPAIPQPDIFGDIGHRALG